MSISRLLPLLAIVLITSLSNAQDYYGITFPTSSKRDMTCNYFDLSFQNKSKETSFVIKREKNKLFFETDDARWFKQLFKNQMDGVAVDIVSKDRYGCGISIGQSPIKGKLLRPVYTEDLRSGLEFYKDDRYRVEVGTIPRFMMKDDLEFNIIFLNNNVKCKYYTIYNLDAYSLDLLDMGVYLDSITYKNKRMFVDSTKSVTRYKTLQFVIPFEKNKSSYNPSDIKPLYDSLRLTDFDIKTIDIKAYASVEGSEKRNMELQEERSKTILSSIQSFQSPEIETKVTSSENWVEFFNDINNTSYQSMKSLTKTQIKSMLTGTLQEELEPVLSKHRKAVVTMELDRIDIYREKTVPELTELFNRAISTDSLMEAIAIQNSLLEKIRDSVTPVALKKIKVPRKKKYVDYINKTLMYDYLIDIKQTLIVQSKLKNILKLDPKNKKILYNLAVLKLIVWRNDAAPVNEKKFKKEIEDLEDLGIDGELVDRMMINYHIVRAEREMFDRNYKEKDKSVNKILDMYESVELSDSDYLSLAQFLAFYAQYGEAIKLLEPRAKQITIDEDLLYYYLNLTLINRQITKTNSYRTIMLNAVNLNKERFCKLFDPSLEGGVTFQLLEDSYLKNSYCENCLE